MARSPKSGKAPDRGLKQEIFGIAVLAAALYVAVSLYPYASANPGGVVGGYLSAGLKKTVGYTSYIFPLLLLALSLKFLLRKVLVISYAVPAAIIVLIVSIAAMLAGISTAEAGGVVGGYLNGFLEDIFGGAGAFIVLSALSLISIVVATGVSIVQAGVKAVPSALSLVRSVTGREAGVEGEEESAQEQSQADEEEEKEEKAGRKEGKAAPAIITPVIHGIQSRKQRHEQKGEEEERLDITAPKGSFNLPPLTLLDPVPERAGSVDSASLLENSKVLEKKLLDFGIEGRVLEVRPGPVVTMYEFEPAPGVKVNKIVGLSDDLALALKAMSIRIIAPIPGKSVVGIEVPNEKKETIKLREILECQAFAKSKGRLSLALGKDISGNPYVADFARMPHLLVAGATGAGKSVSVNAMILSVLFKCTPEEARFLMVDPKMLELSSYEGIPHLITPVITEPKRAASALRGIVSEMGRRYKLMALKGAKNIEMYNHLLETREKEGEEEGNGEEKKLPYIIVVIDELADLMMTSGKDVEDCLVRLSQMARASGIHLLVATQRPSVDVVTGLIKTNFPARIAFQLPSRTDSRTILDSGGAETLLGEGDMLFIPPGTSRLQRIHGAYVSESEIKRVTEFWKKQGAPEYDEVLIEEAEGSEGEDEEFGEEFMRRYDEALELATRMEMISTSYIQRRFRIGYNTAARIIEKMEKDGIVGPAQGSRPREVLKRQ